MKLPQDDVVATDNFERLIEPMTRRINTQARGLFVVFLAMGVATAVVIGIAAVHYAKPDNDIKEDLRLMLGTFLMFACGGLGTRWAIRRDLKYVSRLLTRGATFAGQIESHRVGLNGSHVRVLWDENGTMAGAFFDAERLAEPVPKNIRIRAIPRKSRVGVAINDQLYVANRFTPRP